MPPWGYDDADDYYHGHEAQMLAGLTNLATFDSKGESQVFPGVDEATISYDFKTGILSFNTGRRRFFVVDVRYYTTEPV